MTDVDAAPGSQIFDVPQRQRECTYIITAK